MSTFAKILIGAMALGTMGGLWASFSGVGASDLSKTRKKLRRSARLGSVGHRSRYHRGK